MDTNPTPVAELEKVMAIRRAARAEALGLVRRRALLKQKELAARANLSIAHMSRIERGNVEAKQSTIDRIAFALGIDPAVIENLAKALEALFAELDPASAERRPQSGAPRSGAEMEEELERIDLLIDSEKPS